MTDVPLLSIVFPVYNAEKYLAQAVESILNQTFHDFVFLAINDGSTDGSVAILTDFQAKDSRLQVLHQPHNLGLIAALNRGCSATQSRYIAIMHADDVSLPARFERQIGYLETHPEIGVLGTWIKHLDSQGHIFKEIRYPTLPGLVKWILPFYCSLAHPAVMMRRAAIAPLGFYREGQLVVEDYDLWARASQITQLANYPEVLLYYRLSETSWSGRNKAIQEQNALRIAHRMVTDLIGDVDPNAVRLLCDLAADRMPPTVQDAFQTATLIAQMHRAFLLKNNLAPENKLAVSRDAANKLFILAAHIRRFSVLDSLRLTLRGLTIAPLSRDQIQRGIQRLRAGNRGSYFVEPKNE
jgi:hypothetical protein